MRRGKAWCAMESKYFKITIEEVGRKLKGFIVERSKGFSSWIRFDSTGLGKLLEGLEI